MALPESERLKAAHAYPLADPASDPALAEACRLATLLCHRPIAAVEFILDDHVLIAAAAGLHLTRIPRTEALSPQLCLQPGTLVIPDTLADPRTAHLRLVSAPRGIRFYAAVPLITPEGAILGVLSVWDHTSGHLAPSQSESLEALGRMVMAQLNLGRRQQQLEALEQEHARVEATLRETEAKFRGIFEHTVVGIYQTTPDGHYLSANPMLARIYGYASPEELMASIGDIQHQLYIDPSARNRFIEALQRQETLTNFEAQIRRKDGSVIWISENARAVRDPLGTVRLYEGTVQDITARKIAEDQLRHSEMLYHSLVEELPQNIFRKDRNERFIFANNRFCSTVERPLREILGRTDFDLFPHELAGKYQADDQRVMAEGRTVRETERNVTPDGAVHWVEVIKTPLRDVAGEVIGIQGIFWDVTERKRLQDALAYERDLLQALLDHSPDIIYFKDPQSRFVKGSRALARRFDVADPEELVGKTAFDLLNLDLARTVHAEEQQLLRTGQPIVNEVEELVDRQGRRTWASITKVPIYNRAGATLGLVGVARDITQLIETEQALRNAEENYRAIFENSVEGIYQTSPDGRFLRVNPALARIYGYASTAELLASLTDVRTQVYVAPGRREEFVRDILQKGAITGFESEIHRRDGSTTWVSESARIVRDREGRLDYFEGIVEDISARKLVDAEREKARQSALDSARLKSEFVANVSHEIRTPLNAIIPNTERLLETRLDRQQRYLVENIDHGARMLLRIVDDILHLSKIEAAAVSLEAIDFDVHEVIERALSFFASRAHAKHLDLVGDLRPGVPQTLHGDPSRLAQILNNLLGNAIKFTESGEVVLEVEPGASDDASVELLFRVRDTGIGIPPEARQWIFQAFAQADGSMTRRYGGTGLGLAIARGFVQLMGGSIDFTSQPGNGTTFRFNVRLQRPVKPLPPSPPPPSLLGVRILVLEDNATHRRVIARSLRLLQPDLVAEADSIAAAIPLLTDAARSGHPFDVALFDADLPEGTGLQSARRLRAAAGNSLRLVAINSPGRLLDPRGLEAAGIAGTLVKPLRQSRLATELRAILAGEPLPDPNPDSPALPDDGPRPGQDLLILLVEDQPLNQRVASDLLTRLGARVDAVSSGVEALDAFERHRYDLVLMDCQMPGMDGYETTRRIRDLESQRALLPNPPPRVPIVALSANALPGDRERGMAAGMDDYLTKPLQPLELVRILQPLAPTHPASTPAPSPQAPAPPPPIPPPASSEIPILDPSPLLALSSPDAPEVIREFIDQFLASLPERITRIRAALDAQNPPAVQAEAHALKGNAAYMGTRRLVDACSRLEHAARGADLADGPTLLLEIERHVAEARVALLAYLDSPTPTA